MESAPVTPTSLPAADAASPSFATSRRTFLLRAVSTAALAVMAPASMHAAIAQDTYDDDFMRVSHVAVDGPLDVLTGRALHAALQRADAAFDGHLRELAHRIGTLPPTTVESLAQALDASGEQALRKTLNQIVSAWYLGIVGARTFAYAGALMYRSTADVLSPPSYVHGEPLHWVSFEPPHRS